MNGGLCRAILLGVGIVASSLTAAEAVRVSERFGFDPVDSTKILQKALDSGAPRIVVDKQSGAWITGPLFGRSNQEIVFEPGVELLAKKGEFRSTWDSLFTLDVVSNVTIRGAGAIWRMRRDDYDSPAYEHGEHRMALNVHSGRNITVEGLALVESGGDGIYLGVGRPEDGPCRNIVLRDVVCDRNYRQGMSVISVDGLLVERCVFSNTKGTPPQAGVDFEPNFRHEQLQNVVLRDCRFENNFSNGIELYFYYPDATTPPTSILVENCRFSGNRRGFGTSNGGSRDSFTPGKVEFRGCTFENERQQAVSIHRKPLAGLGILFDNCAFINCQSEAKEPEKENDITLGVRTFGDAPTDGIEFRDCTVRQPVARNWLSRKTKVPASGAPKAITGKVTVVSPKGEKTYVLDEDWRRRYFGTKGFAPGMQAFDPSTARVVNPRPGEMLTLNPICFRNNVRYRFYAPGAGRVAFRGKVRHLGAKGFRNPMMTVKDVSDKVLAEIPIPDKDGNFTFEAPTAGFYLLEIDLGNHAFTLLACSVPVAVDVFAVTQNVFGTGGILFFRVVKDQNFALVFCGADKNEGVRAVVKDPAGTVVWSGDDMHDWERCHLTAGTSGLWQIVLEKPSRLILEDYRFRMLGVQPILFLSSERYW